MLTQEHRNKISEAHKGLKHTEETRSKLSKALKGRKFTDETHKKMSASKLGNMNAWKENKITYNTLHTWIRKELGNIRKCENCDDTHASRYEWANISGGYVRDITDWARLCKRCHNWIDDIGRKNKLKENNMNINKLNLMEVQ